MGKFMILLESDTSALGGLIVLGGGWTLACIIVGAIGKDKTVGFWGCFFISFFFSPLIGFIVALASSTKKAPPKAYTCPCCQLTSYNPQYYCVRCGKDMNGFTLQQNQEKFK